MNDDAELLRRGRSDPAAFRALVDAHAQYLYGVAHALTRNNADAEDLVQETLLGAIRGTFRGESSVRTWLVRILVNRAGMLRRTRKRKPVQELASDVASSAKAQACGVDARIDLTEMLAELSEDHREVLILRELEGLSYEEMAAALGVPRGTVESRLHRARQELRRKFHGYEAT